MNNLEVAENKIKEVINSKNTKLSLWGMNGINPQKLTDLLEKYITRLSYIEELILSGNELTLLTEGISVSNRKLIALLYMHLIKPIVCDKTYTRKKYA